MGRRALVPLLLLLATGCAQTFDAANLGVPVTMAGAPGEIPPGAKPFKVKSHTVHGLWGLMTFSQANLKKGLARELVGADQIAQLKIKTRARFWDIVVTAITAGIVVPKTVYYEGIVIGR